MTHSECCKALALPPQAHAAVNEAATKMSAASGIPIGDIFKWIADNGTMLWAMALSFLAIFNKTPVTPTVPPVVQ